MKGLFQIFPTTGSGEKILMGDILCRAIYYEANLPRDQMYVRFFSNPYQLIKPHLRDELGLLTFEISEFLSLLEMSEVFRHLILPAEQKEIWELASINEPEERQFYWGRLFGRLDSTARDMLAGWNIRNWPKEQIKLLYELFNYVVLPQTH